jgi:hypothetical protein
VNNHFLKTLTLMTALSFLAACGVEEPGKPHDATTPPADGGTTVTPPADAGTTVVPGPTDSYTATDVVRLVGSDVLFNGTYLGGASSGFVRGDLNGTNWGVCATTAQVSSVQPGWLTVPVGKLTGDTLAVGSAKSYRFTLIGTACGAGDWAQYGTANASAMTNKHCLEETSGGRNIKIKVTRTDATNYAIVCDGTL